MNRIISITFMIIITMFSLLGCDGKNDLKNPLHSGDLKTTTLVGFAPRIASSNKALVAKVAATEAIDRATVYVYDSPWTINGTPL